MNKELEDRIKSLVKDVLYSSAEQRSELTGIGAPAVPFIIAGFRSRPGRTSISTGIRKYMLASVLAEIGEPALQPAIKGLAGKNANVRQYCANALGRMGDCRAVEPLLANLDDGDLSVRLDIVKSLGLIGDKRALAPLVECLRKETTSIRKEIIEAISKFGSEAVREIYSAAAREKDRDAKERLAEALLMINEKMAKETNDFGIVEGRIGKKDAPELARIAMSSMRRRQESPGINFGRLVAVGR